ncbi:MAG: glycosyltransferase [Bacteroidota bacterium]
MDKNLKHKNPKVTVLLPVFNGEKFLKESIQSILSQTFPDFELLIVNDGSTDDSEKIIKNFSDERINLFNNEKNLGLIETLNIGLKNSTGEYIARMDADDISLPNRLKKQVSFLDSHPLFGICATRYALLNEKRKKINWWFRTDDIPSMLLFNASICHPTIMMRRKIIMENQILYSHKFTNAEDYELWIRISQISRIAILDEELFYYRSHRNQVSRAFNSEQKKSADEVRKNYLLLLGLKFTDEELTLHNIIGRNERIKNKKLFSDIEKWLLSLIQMNSSNCVLEQSALKKVIGKMWLDICGNTTLGLWAFHNFFKSILKNYYQFNFGDLIKLFCKCIVRYIVR